MIGVCNDVNKPMRLVYSVRKCIEILYRDVKFSKKDFSQEEIAEGMTNQQKKWEMALEYFDFNVSGAYVGEQTPVWCEDNF